MAVFFLLLKSLSIMEFFSFSVFSKVLFTRMSSWTLRADEFSCRYISLCISEIYDLPVFFQGLIAVGLEFRLGGGPILNPCRTPNSKLFDGFFGK